MPAKKSITVSLPFQEAPRSLRIRIPAPLYRYSIAPKTFLEEKNQYVSLAFGIFVFYPEKAGIVPRGPWDFRKWPSDIPIPPSRLLLLQRTHIPPDDAGIWEVPGGSSELTDPTILHSVVTHMFAATGLVLERFMREIGSGIESETAKGRRFTLSFEIEAEELAMVRKKLQYVGLGHLPIQIDPDVHAEFVWATEAEIREDIFPVATPQQRAVILQAFRLRREDEEEMRELALSGAPRYGKSKSTVRGADRSVEGDGDDEDDKKDVAREADSQDSSYLGIERLKIQKRDRSADC